MNIFLNKSKFIYWYKNLVNVRNSDMHFYFFLGCPLTGTIYSTRHYFSPIRHGTS